MNSPLKKLDQSVFDGLPPEYKFADVDEHGRVFVYAYKPCVRCFDGTLSLIPGKFDATDWQNSLIEREEITDDDDLRQVPPEEIAAAKKPQPLRRGDLIEYDGDICVVYKKFVDGDNIGYRVVSLTGDAGRWYVTHGELTRIGSIRKKIKRLKAQFVGDEK